MWQNNNLVDENSKIIKPRVTIIRDGVTIKKYDVLCSVTLPPHCLEVYTNGSDTTPKCFICETTTKNTIDI